MKKYFIFMLLFCSIGLGPINKVVAMKRTEKLKKELKKATKLKLALEQELDKLRLETSPGSSEKNSPYGAKYHIYNFIDWCCKQKLKAAAIIAIITGLETLVTAGQWIPGLNYQYTFGTKTLQTIRLLKTLIIKYGVEFVLKLFKKSNSGDLGDET